MPCHVRAHGTHDGTLPSVCGRGGCTATHRHTPCTTHTRCTPVSSTVQVVVVAYAMVGVLCGAVVATQHGRLGRAWTAGHSFALIIFMSLWLPILVWTLAKQAKWRG